jgi:hypothetical protein
MKKLALFILVTLFTAPALAQEAREYTLQVVPDSAFIRATPDEDAEVVGSVFANDSLTAVGRNIDGEWIEVRRPGRTTGGGWIARRVTAFTFNVGQLPITDLTTGLIGDEPVVDTGFSILMISEGTLRAAPDRYSSQLDIIPVNLTLPVLERTPDNQWLRINYRGTVGWIAEFTTHPNGDLNAMPISPEYSDDPQFAAFEIIPVEVQVAQIDDLLNYLSPLSVIAADVTHYWKMMSQGETMECLPPAGNFAYYTATQRDITELPELRQQRRLLTLAVDDLNAAIATMGRCGVYTQTEIRAAYADALNAMSIFQLVIERMENQREVLTGEEAATIS